MLRAKRLELLEKYVRDINKDMSDLPKNENRFSIEADADERGYRVVFSVIDNWKDEYAVYVVRWQPMKTKFGYYYPMDLFERINKFVIDRKVN